MIQTLIKELLKNTESFKFHRIGFLDADEKEQSSWMALIETKEQLNVWFSFMAQKNASAWYDIKDSPEGKSGHCRTTYANVWKDLLEIYMFKYNKPQMSMIDCLQFIEHNSTKTAIDLFYENGSVYVNKSGGCRDTNIRNDDRIKEKIFERCSNRDFIFPSMSKNDVEIKRWAMGKHFYIVVGDKTVQIKGVDKFNTIKAAEEAKKDFLKKNRFNTR